MVPLSAAANAQPAAARRRAAVLGLSLGCVGVALLSAWTTSLRAVAPSPSSLAFAAGLSAGVPATRRGEAVVMHGKKRMNTAALRQGRSPLISTLDRDRLARRRQEMREENRERRGQPAKTMASLNYEKLPSVEDIFSRTYSGDERNDPIGGRKRYTLYLMFKYDPAAQGGPQWLRDNVLEYITFMKRRISCRNVIAEPMLSPIDGRNKITQLEYPMREYGALPKGQYSKVVYNKGLLVKFQFSMPPTAHDYLDKKIYDDNNILRKTLLVHTHDFGRLGEDNELHL